MSIPRTLLSAVFILAFSMCQSEPESPAIVPSAGSPRFQDYGDFGGDFELTDHNGSPFRLKDHRGSVFLIFFGYTFCPDACPTMMSKLTTAFSLADLEQNDSVTTLYITIDPERDTPDQMKEYLQYFSSLDVLGLTGTEDEIDDVVMKYGASYEKVEGGTAAGYLMNHSTWLYLIDRDGKLKYRFRHADEPAFVAAGLEKILQ